MHKLFEVFGRNQPESWNRKIFIPVIHLPHYSLAFEAAYREARIAYKAGAHGVALISHGEMLTSELNEVYRWLKASLVRDGIQFPLAINWLELTSLPGDAIYEAADNDADMLWSDASGGEAEVKSAIELSGYAGIYGGAFAFKVGPHVPNEALPQALEAAFSFMDVPITSGSGTGVPIDLEKARICREVANGRPIGVASGVSMENLPELIDCFDLFLVSSSLQLNGDWYRHDPVKVKEMANFFRSWHPRQ